MKLRAPYTGVTVEAEGAAAERLVASGFKKAEPPRKAAEPKPKAKPKGKE